MEYTEVLINIRKIVRSINLESKRIQKEPAAFVRWNIDHTSDA